MKLQLNKLMAGLVMAGTVVALVGCGDGGSPTLGAAADVTATIKATDTKAIATTKAVVSAFGTTGVDFALAKEVKFDGSTVSIPANSTITLTPTTSTAPGAIANFGIKSPDGKSANGGLLAGSCKFEVTGPLDDALRIAGYAINSTFTIQNCTLALPTGSTLVNVPNPISPTFTLNGEEATTTKTITITILDNGQVTSGGAAIADVPLASGS